MPSDTSESVEKMVQAQLEARGIRDAGVLNAMRTIPRHRFVPDLSPDLAYADRALPTINGQTISQPYIVARMTELLDARPGMKVLEVGTGSGYQTAILARLGLDVVSVERDADLMSRARAVLNELCPLAPIELCCTDGSLGLPDEAPFDRILVTAAAPKLPGAYEQQLADPGRIVIPLGDRDAQTLTVIDHKAGRFTIHEDLACRFVPLVGRDGWS